MFAPFQGVEINDSKPPEGATRSQISPNDWCRPYSHRSRETGWLRAPLGRRRLGEVANAFPGRPFRPGVLERVHQLLGELRRHVHARDDDARDVALLDLVVDAGEGDRELVVRERDVGEVRVDAGQVRGIEMDVELALGGVAFVVHWRGYYCRGPLRQPPPLRLGACRILRVDRGRNG